MISSKRIHALVSLLVGIVLAVLCGLLLDGLVMYVSAVVISAAWGWYLSRIGYPPLPEE